MMDGYVDGLLRKGLKALVAFQRPGVGVGVGMGVGGGEMVACHSFGGLICSFFCFSFDFVWFDL